MLELRCQSNVADPRKEVARVESNPHSVSVSPTLSEL